MPGTGMTPEGLSPPQTMKFKPSLGERVKLHKGISNILRKMGLKAKLILVQKKNHLKSRHSGGLPDVHGKYENYIWISKSI